MNISLRLFPYLSYVHTHTQNTSMTLQFCQLKKKKIFLIQMEKREIFTTSTAWNGILSSSIPQDLILITWCKLLSKKRLQDFLNVYCHIKPLNCFLASNNTMVSLFIFNLFYWCFLVRDVLLTYNSSLRHFDVRIHFWCRVWWDTETIYWGPADRTGPVRGCRQTG